MPGSTWLTESDAVGRVQGPAPGLGPHTGSNLTHQVQPHAPAIRLEYQKSPAEAPDL